MLAIRGTSPVRRLAILTSAVGLATALVDAQVGRTQPAPQATYSRAEAATMATHLYRAALGRDGTPAEISQLTAAIQRGALQGQVASIVAGNEFRTALRRMNSAQLLEQFYKGLLNREPDTVGVTQYLPRLEGRRHADVLVEMVTSKEFRQKMASSGAGPEPPTPTRLESAIDCQARVLDAARRDASGLVFFSFDRVPDVAGEGRTVSGPGVDRFDQDRQLTYRCDGPEVSVVYADRGRVAGADRRLEFPSAAVRACMGAARDDAGRAIVFDAASLSASDTRAEYVIGLAANTTTRVICEMDGTRVVSVRKQQ